MRKAVVVVTVWASLVTVCVLLLLVWIGRPKEGPVLSVLVVVVERKLRFH